MDLEQLPFFNNTHHPQRERWFAPHVTADTQYYSHVSSPADYCTRLPVCREGGWRKPGCTHATELLLPYLVPQIRKV